MAVPVDGIVANKRDKKNPGKHIEQLKKRNKGHYIWFGCHSCNHNPLQDSSYSQFMKISDIFSLFPVSFFSLTKRSCGFSNTSQSTNSDKIIELDFPQNETRYLSNSFGSTAWTQMSIMHKLNYFLQGSHNILYIHRYIYIYHIHNNVTCY